MGLVQGFLTFLMFRFFGGGKNGLLLKNVSDRRKSPTPHRKVKMASVTQGVKMELSHVSIKLLRDRRGFSII